MLQTYINNINNIITPPYNPPKGEAPARKRKRSNEPKEAPDWKPERFAAFWAAYGLNLWTFVAGEAVACYVLGTVLLRALPKVKYFRPMIPAAHLN